MAEARDRGQAIVVMYNYGIIDQCHMMWTFPAVSALIHTYIVHKPRILAGISRIVGVHVLKMHV